eukprot:3456483-Prymnesium_polylepis.1
MVSISAMPMESPSVRRARCMLAWLLVFEGFLVFFSAATMDQGGYFGLIGSGLVLVGTLTALLRGCGDAERGFTIMLVLTALAVGCTLIQVMITITLLVTDEGHFTRRRNDGIEEELDRDTTRAMLVILILAYASGLSIRFTVALTIARVRKGTRSPR